MFVYLWLWNIVIYVIYDYDFNLQFEGLERETGTEIFIAALCLEYGLYCF